MSYKLYKPPDIDIGQQPITIGDFINRYINPYRVNKELPEVNSETVPFTFMIVGAVVSEKGIIQAMSKDGSQKKVKIREWAKSIVNSIRLPVALTFVEKETNESSLVEGEIVISQGYAVMFFENVYVDTMAMFGSVLPAGYDELKLWGKVWTVYTDDNYHAFFVEHSAMPPIGMETSPIKAALVLVPGNYESYQSVMTVCTS